MNQHKQIKVSDDFNFKMPPPNCMKRGEEDYKLICKALRSRAFKHPVTKDWSELTEHGVNTIYDRGWFKFGGLLNDHIDLIDSIQSRMEEYLDKGGEHCIYHSSNSNLPQGDINDQELYMSVKQPLVRVPEIAKVIFNKHILEIVKCFFKCVPAVGTLNLRRSFANDLKPDQTNLYHCDSNSPLLLKLFFYLNDVDKVEDGPFNYVEGSAFDLPSRWRESVRVPDEGILAAYSEDRIKDLTAKKGDVLAAMTTGYHKGQKVRSKDRSMLTLNFVVAPEYWDTRLQFDISENAVTMAKDQINAGNICLLDFLNVVQ